VIYSSSSGSRAIFLSHEPWSFRRKSGLRGEEERQDCGVPEVRIPWTAVSDADDDIGNNTCDSAYYNSAKQHIATMLLQSLISALLVFILPVSAQFQFFEQMFNQGGHQQQQQPQNAGSDSAWYQQRYEDGMD